MGQHGSAVTREYLLDFIAILMFWIARPEEGFDQLAEVALERLVVEVWRP